MQSGAEVGPLGGQHWPGKGVKEQLREEHYHAQLKKRGQFLTGSRDHNYSWNLNRLRIERCTVRNYKISKTLERYQLAIPERTYSDAIMTVMAKSQLLHLQPTDRRPLSEVPDRNGLHAGLEVPWKNQVIPRIPVIAKGGVVWFGIVWCNC